VTAAPVCGRLRPEACHASASTKRKHYTGLGPTPPLSRCPASHDDRVAPWRLASTGREAVSPSSTSSAATQTCTSFAQSAGHRAGGAQASAVTARAPSGLRRGWRGGA
jgi:hypothetical protein